MAWDLKIERPGQGEALEHKDVLVVQGARGGGRSSMGDFFVGAFLAYEKHSDGGPGKRIGALACADEQSIEFTSDGIRLRGNPIEISERLNCTKREQVWQNWILTFAAQPE